MIKFLTYLFFFATQVFFQILKIEYVLIQVCGNWKRETGNPPFSIYPPETECKLDTDHWVSVDIYCNKTVQDCAQEGVIWWVED